MAGYKGYGYAATVEILCAALQGNKWGEELSDAYIEDGVKKRRPSRWAGRTHYSPFFYIKLYRRKRKSTTHYSPCVVAIRCIHQHTVLSSSTTTSLPPPPPLSVSMLRLAPPPRPSPMISHPSSVTRHPSLISLGHFFIAINVESFTSLDEFQRTCGQILRDLRGSEKDPNAGGRIYTAGEPEHLAWVHRSNTGGTPVPKKLQEDMAQLRDNFPAKLQEKYRSLPFEK